MIRGLDGDETVFLDLVAKQQEEIANRRFDEESQEIKEYRVWRVTHLFPFIILPQCDCQNQSTRQIQDFREGGLR